MINTNLKSDSFCVLGFQYGIDDVQGVSFLGSGSPTFILSLPTPVLDVLSVNGGKGAHFAPSGCHFTSHSAVTAIHHFPCASPSSPWTLCISGSLPVFI